jgi:L-glutamine-phosphate cytidylyltransferase
MKAIILAAGRGSRMQQMTDDRPKCLVELHGRALIDLQIDALRAGGVDQIAVVTGYRREALATRGLVEFHNTRWAETNMVSSLECAHAWLESGPCIVSYSDIFYQPEAVRALVASSAAMALTYDVNWLALWTRRFGDPLLDAETFRLDSQGHLREIGNKPLSLEAIQGQYMGLLRFTPQAWHEIVRIRAAMPAAERDRMHMTGTLQKVIDAARVAVVGVPYAGEWGEVDSAEDLRAYL